MGNSAAVCQEWTAILVLEDILTQVVSRADSNMVKTRQCHHCHRPTSHPEHVGIGSGVNLCTLGHFDLCPGGREQTPDWTGCPETSSAEETDGMVNKESKDLSEKVMSGLSEKLDQNAITKSILEAAKIAEKVDLEQFGDDESSDSEEESILASEIEQLKMELQKSKEDEVQQKQAKAKADRKEHKRLNRKRLEEEKADLLRKTKNHKDAQMTGHGDTDTLHQKAADLAARQQKAAADRQQQARTVVEQLTIGGLRSMPGASSEVDALLTGLQALIPSLAKTPSAPSTSGPAFQPSGILNSQKPDGEDIDSDFVFHPGRGKFVRVVHSPARKVPDQTSFGGTAAMTRFADGDEVTSADEDCSIVPPPGYSFIWKRDSNGEKYFIKKKLSKPATPDKVLEYVCDEVSGRWYKREVPRSAMAGGPHVAPVSIAAGNTQHSSGLIFKDHRQVDSTPVPLVMRGVRTPTGQPPLPRSERIPGIVPINSDKQGKGDKIPDRVQWAKNCPVDWTNKVNASNINLVLWAWSYIAEVLATRTGMAPNLEIGELEARLQHFCNVLEITMQTSSLADFVGDSWAVARLYDKKVQQKVDNGLFSWVKLADMNHGGSLPHELIAATQELTRKPKGSGGVKSGDGKPGDTKSGDGRGKGSDRTKAGWKCPSWNYSEVRGKCRFEVDNAPEKCNRVHECSWCKSRQLTQLDHQRFFCTKRKAEEER